MTAREAAEARARFELETAPKIITSAFKLLKESLTALKCDGKDGAVVVRAVDTISGSASVLGNDFKELELPDEIVAARVKLLNLHAAFDGSAREVVEDFISSYESKARARKGDPIPFLVALAEKLRATYLSEDRLDVFIKELESCKRKRGEEPGEYAIRLKKLNKLAGGGTKGHWDDKETLRRFCIGCGPDLATEAKGEKTLDEAASAITKAFFLKQFNVTEEAPSTAPTPSPSQTQAATAAAAVPEEAPGRVGGSRAAGRGRRGGGGRGGGRGGGKSEFDPASSACYHCGGLGHIERFCPWHAKYADKAAAKKARIEAETINNKEMSSYSQGGAGPEAAPELQRRRANWAGNRWRPRGRAREPARGVRSPSSAITASHSAPARSSSPAAAAAGLPQAATRRRFHVMVDLGGRQIKALVDTGADCSIVGRSVFKGMSVQYNTVGQHFDAIVLVGGQRIAILGHVKVRINIGRREVLAEMLVVDGHDLLLGTDVLGKLGVMDAVEAALKTIGADIVEAPTLPVEAAAAAGEDSPSPDDRYVSEAEIMALKLTHLGPTQQERLRQVLLKHRKAFIRDGALPYPCKAPPAKIRVVDDGPAMMPARRRTPEAQEELRRHEEKLLKWDIVERVLEAPPVAYRAEAHLVYRDDKPDSRHVIDYTLVNPRILDDPFPIPNMQDQINNLGGCKAFSKFDVGSGFFIQELDEESRKYTIFRATIGLLQFKRLPFGLKTSPAIFCRLIQNLLLNDLQEEVKQHLGAYVDDIAHGSPGETFDEAVDPEIDAIDTILTAAEESEISFRLSKCAFCEPELEYCGAEIVDGKRKPAPSNVKAIIDFGEFRTKTHVLSWLGMLVQCRDNIPGLALMEAPLRRVAKGPGPLKMTVEAHKARAAIERAVSSMGAVKIPVPGKESVLRVDASTIGLGFVLEQDGEVVKYSGRPLTDAERNYSTPDRELLAVHDGLDDVEGDIGGRHVRVIVKSDHQSVKGAPKRPDARRNAMRVRWKANIARYNATIEYVPREEQAVADAIAKSPAFEKSEATAAAVYQVVSAEKVDPAVWRGRQQRDEEVRILTTYKETGQMPRRIKKERADGLARQAEHCQLVDGVLYHIKEIESRRKDGTAEVVSQLWVPDVDGLRERYLRRAHGSAPREGEAELAEGAHEGAQKMFERLRRDFYWPTMLDDCTSTKRRCFVCKAREALHNNYGLLDPTRSDRLKGKHLVCLDLAGPFPQSRDGFTHVAIYVKMNTGWPVVVPLKKTDAPAILRSFMDGYLPDRGTPSDILTDRASNLNAETAQALFNALGVKKHTTTSFHPQADPAETMVRAVKTLCAKLVNELGVDWADAIPQILTRLRSWHKLPYEMSPFKAEHGYEMQLPSVFDNPLHTEALPDAAARERIDRLILELRDKAAEEYKKKYDKERQEKTFKVGDRVWWKENEPAHTLANKRTGPYQVKLVISPINYELAEVNGGPAIGRRHPVVHIQQIEEFEQEWPGAPEWEVERILSHKRRKKTVRYEVLWVGGAITWEPLKNLIDKEDNGTTTVSDPLIAYWEDHPQLRKLAGL